MCNLIQKKDQIFDFAFDVFNGVIDALEKNESHEDKRYVLKICLRELEGRKGSGKNRISMEIHKFVEENPDFSERAIKPLSDFAPLKEVKGRGYSRFPNSIIFEIDGNKFQALASGFTPEVNIFICITLLAFVANKSTVSVYNILAKKKVKLPDCLRQNGHYLHEMLMSHHWDHFDGVRKLN